jgi:glycosyltransferase involved in cell wall biosynthesis
MIDELCTGGTETQLVALIRNLNRDRVRPYLCLLKGESKRSRALEPGDCPVLRLGVRSLHHPATVAKAVRLARFFRRQRIDVLQVYFPDSSYLGVPVARLAGVRHVVRTRNNLGYWMTPLHRWLGWLCNRWADLTVANCEACRRAVVAGEGAPPGRVRILENGVDLSRFPWPPRPLLNGQTPGPRVGVVANLRPVKDLDVFVRAAAEVSARHPGATFHVAGEGDQRPDLERLAAELGLAGRFFLPGSVKDVPAFLAGLDVAVLCSRSEGMSNAVLEYMAAGKAVVATTVGANTQLIEDGVHGLLVPPGNGKQLAVAISRLLADGKLATRLGAAARARVEERYSREAMVRRFEDFFEELIVGNSRSELPTDSRSESATQNTPETPCSTF